MPRLYDIDKWDRPPLVDQNWVPNCAMTYKASVESVPPAMKADHFQEFMMNGPTCLSRTRFWSQISNYILCGSVRHFFPWQMQEEGIIMPSMHCIRTCQWSRRLGTNGNEWRQLRESDLLGLPCSNWAQISAPRALNVVMQQDGQKVGSQKVMWLLCLSLGLNWVGRAHKRGPF